MVFELAPEEFDVSPVARLKVLGIGGAGGNAVNRMIEAGLSGVDFIAVNTDHQVLERSEAPIKIQIGTKITKGLGAGGDPEIGRKAAEEDKDLIAEHLENTDMLFITAGMGGGTGTGAAPVIAKLAKDMGILTVAVVTKPFRFEGRTRQQNAEQGLQELKNVVDTLIVIPNEKLLALEERDTPFLTAFARADEVLLHATQGISELITKPGLINLDFADVRSVLQGMGGDALMGTGIANGEGRAIEAAQKAISSPLMDNVSIAGAKGVLINITGDPTLSLVEASEAATLISEQAGPDANIIFGVALDESLQDEVRITVIAAGFQRSAKQQKTPVKTSLGQRFVQAMDMFDARQSSGQVISRENAQQEQHEDTPEPAVAMTAPTFIPPAQQTEQPQQREEKEEMAKSSPSEETLVIPDKPVPGLMDFSKDDYDTPAFMRRRKAASQ